jgi:hypothetical protein
MGVDYYYLNRDKKQYFPCGMLNRCGRFRSIGQSPAGRALALLLEERGAWANDRIAVIADSSAEWEEVFVSGIDIQADVELMLFDVDGFSWFKEEIEDPIVFRELCAIALILRRQDVIAFLNETVGVHKWEAKYHEHLKHNTDHWSQRIVEAGERRLRLRT